MQEFMEELKIIIFILSACFFLCFSIKSCSDGCNNDSNKTDKFIKAGYSQKMVPKEYEEIWVKEGKNE